MKWWPKAKDEQSPDPQYASASRRQTFVLLRIDIYLVVLVLAWHQERLGFRE